MTTDAPVPMDELIERQKLRGLYDLRVRAREFVEKAEELTDLQESTVRHANARASGRKQAVEELAKMGLDEHGIPIKKLGAILVLAFAVSMVVGFSPATEVRPMTQTMTDPLACARDAIKAHDWKTAIKYFRSALAGGERPEECLFRIAECQFHEKDYDGAWETCTDLDVISRGLDCNAPMVRGWIYEAKGKTKTAKNFYLEAARKGNKDAETRAKRIS